MMKILCKGIPKYFYFHILNNPGNYKVSKRAIERMRLKISVNPDYGKCLVSHFLK